MRCAETGRLIRIASKHRGRPPDHRNRHVRTETVYTLALFGPETPRPKPRGERERERNTGHRRPLNIRSLSDMSQDLLLGSRQGNTWPPSRCHHPVLLGGCPLLVGFTRTGRGTVRECAESCVNAGLWKPPSFFLGSLSFAHFRLRKGCIATVSHLPPCTYMSFFVFFRVIYIFYGILYTAKYKGS